MKCKICGRPIKAEESLERGVGPTCAKHTPAFNLNDISNEQTKYWIIEAYESFPAIFVLMRKQFKLEAAFFAHLAVEKALKSLVSQETCEVPPKIHNLV